ncbi:MAG: CBS domain-containing protein [Nitrospinaceae bacterium]
MSTIKVLIIDDDEDYIVLIRDWLEESPWNIEMESASSSREGMEKLNDGDFDCVLADYIIPGVTGLEVLKTLKDSGNHTPVIIMTAFGDEGWGEELIQKGAFDFISKDHLNLEVLQDKISKAASKGKQRKALYEGKIRAGEIRQHMNSPVLSIPSDWNLQEVIQQINSHRVGSLLVRESGEFVGIVTKKDLIRKVAGKKLDHETTKVSAVMTKSVLSLDGNTPAADAVKFMREKNIKRLPVTEDGKITGIVSVRDLLD